MHRRCEYCHCSTVNIVSFLSAASLFDSLIVGLIDVCFVCMGFHCVVLSFIDWIELIFLKFSDSCVRLIDETALMSE